MNLDETLSQGCKLWPESLGGMQVMARITGLVGMFLGNSRRSEWFTSVVVGLWANAWP